MIDLQFIETLGMIKLLDWIKEKIAMFEPVQWMLFLIGATLVGFGLYSAWKSYRIASYSISVKVAKFGFTLIVISFAWDNIKWIYETAMQMTGNPVLAFVLILAGGFLGINTIKLLVAGGSAKK
ncbi:hypothetical protein Asulf_00947 [Archaeoglobus sulfaticallidus PM70-1]|uniref:Uncharacterized protein n=1 Tax=Archaeoglobus sulfaticallidus PM70-1 TaxID=387631 RepID=N0BKC6_9EURY|nr:hypothetical protein [Archaeoglobus sulfaticallidus]AGK60951.1 hypothetical protein Asulf_00947 [Archaeoglobus sulfaticallidus PM70-1]